MGTIADAAGLPQLPDQTNSFANVMSNADAVADEAVQTGNDNGAQQKAAQGQQAPPFHKVSYKANKDGGFDVEVSMPSSTYDYLGNLLQTGQQAQQAFSQARMLLAKKREFQEQHPIISGIGKIAGLAAAGYGNGFNTVRGGGRISPLVRAAGAYGLDQFGETPSQLAQQEAVLQGQEFDVANRITNQFQQEGIVNFNQQREIAQATRDQQRIKVDEQTLQAQLARDAAIREEKKRDDIQNFTNTVVNNARNNRMFSDAEAQAVAASAASLGYPPEQAAALIKRAKEIATAAQVKYEQDIKTKTDAEIRAAHLRDESAAKKVALETEKALTLEDAKHKSRLEEEANKAALKATAAGEKISSEGKKAMVQMSVVEKNVKDVREVIEKHPEYLGIVGGAMTKATALLDPTASSTSASIQHLFAQLAKGYGGARGFSKVEQPVFKDLAGSVFNEPEALDAKLKEIENWIASNRSAWFALEPGLQRLAGNPTIAGVSGQPQAKPVTPTTPGEKVQKFNPETGKLE